MVRAKLEVKERAPTMHKTSDLSIEDAARILYAEALLKHGLRNARVDFRDLHPMHHKQWIEAAQENARAGKRVTDGPNPLYYS